MPLNPTSLPGRGSSGYVRTNTPLLQPLLILKSRASSKSDQTFSWMSMYPPQPWGLSAPCSTSVLLGDLLLVIQPSSVFPSKSNTQPAAFSAGAKVLSAPRTCSEASEITEP